jgi:hypothetical protein
MVIRLQDGKYAMEGDFINPISHIIASCKNTDLICGLYNLHRQKYELSYQPI